MNNSTNLNVGNIVCFQESNKLTSTYQKLLDKTEYANTTHVGIISKIDETGIYLLESISSGVQIRHFDHIEFQKYFQEGKFQILDNKELNKSFKKVIPDFAFPYINNSIKTKYEAKHFFNLVAHASKETTISRNRTVENYKRRKLMTSKGKLKKGVICSELVAEIIKVSQIYAGQGNEFVKVDASLLKDMQKNQKVLKFDSKAISPASLVHQLVKKHNFTFITS